MPVTTYCCSHCDVQLWDVATWGVKEYLLPDGQRPRVERALGWCYACQRPEGVEVLDLEARRVQLDVAEEELARLGGEHFRANVLYALPGPWRSQLAEWARKALACAERQAIVIMLESRQSPARCLRCGSSQVIQPLDPHPEPKPYDEPWRTGFRHPGCEGEILGGRDGTRNALKSRVLTYSPEGEPLSDVPDAWDCPSDG